MDEITYFDTMREGLWTSSESQGSWRRGLAPIG